MQQSYAPSRFVDPDRLSKIQAVLPEIDKIYTAHCESNHIAGFAYGIMVDGQLLHSRAGGLMDVERKIPATPQSMFRIASMTKSFTAMAILRLRDEKSLRLDDPAHLYIPEIKNFHLSPDTPAITIRDLLTHSAGFPTDDPWGDRHLDQSSEDFLKLIQSGIFFSNTPGTTYEYSNMGFAMLGYIISKVSGVPYDKYIEEYICKPLGMKVSFEYRDVDAAELAKGYRFADEHFLPEPMLGNGIWGAMGGMITSVESLSRYAAFHQLAWPPRSEKESGPIHRSSVREMHQPHRFIDVVRMADSYSDGTERSITACYGYGLRWKRDSRGKVFVGHSGGLPGFGSNWMVMPEYGIGAIFLANRTYAPAERANFNVLEKLIVAAQLKPRELPPSQKLLERYQALKVLLPGWKNAEESGIFAMNFFLDFSAETRRKESAKLFDRAGHIVSVSDLVAQSQSTGHFTIKCEISNLVVEFSLSAERSAPIQEVEIKAV